MSFYKCGHDRGIVIMDSNILSFAEYEQWRETVGFDGDKSLCHNCYVKKQQKERIFREL